MQYTNTTEKAEAVLSDTRYALLKHISAQVRDIAKDHYGETVDIWVEECDVHVKAWTSDTEGRWRHASRGCYLAFDVDLSAEESITRIAYDIYRKIIMDPGYCEPVLQRLCEEYEYGLGDVVLAKLIKEQIGEYQAAWWLSEKLVMSGLGNMFDGTVRRVTRPHNTLG